LPFESSASIIRPAQGRACQPRGQAKKAGLRAEAAKPRRPACRAEAAKPRSPVSGPRPAEAGPPRPDRSPPPAGNTRGPENPRYMACIAPSTQGRPACGGTRRHRSPRSGVRVSTSSPAGKRRCLLIAYRADPAPAYGRTPRQLAQAETIAAGDSSGVIVAVSGMPSLNGLPPAHEGALARSAGSAMALTSAKKRSSITTLDAPRKTESRSSDERRRYRWRRTTAPLPWRTAESRVRRGPAPTRASAREGGQPEDDPFTSPAPSRRPRARRRETEPNVLSRPGVPRSTRLRDLLDGRRS